MSKKNKITLALLSFFSVMLVPTTAKADSLTSLFNTRAFSGSMSTISKLNWVGWLLSGIISVFCLVGLFLTVFRIMASLMYLSGRNVFDKIHEIKTSGSGGVLGVKDQLFTALKGGNSTGTGLDSIIYFLLSLLPDVKMYSDFADGADIKGLSKDATATEYLLKISIPTVMMIFFLSIGFSGTLWQMFGTCVDAMVVAAEKVANTNLSSSVERLLNADSYYQFGFGDDGSKWGKLQENMAKDMYNKVLSKCDGTINGDNSLLLGETIGSYFTGTEIDGAKHTFTPEGIAKICGDEKYADDENEAENVKYNIIINSIEPSSSANDIVIPLSNISDAMMTSTKKQGNEKSFSASGMYMHVYIYRKASATQVNYFSSKDKKVDTDTTKGNGSVQVQDFPQ